MAMPSLPDDRTMNSRGVKPTNIVLLLAILINHKTVDSVIVQGPSDTTAMVNESTYFNCSTSIRPISEQSIIWFHFPLDGGGQRNYVYDDGRIMTNYRNRFDIDIDLSSGSLNLIALRLELKDAGRYECRDDILEGQGSSAELTVLESHLMCESDLNPGGVVARTQCDKVIAPKEEQLTCRVTYNGKTAPQMLWRKSGDSSTSTETDCMDNYNRVTCNTTLTTNYQLSGSVYYCELTTQRYNCSLEIRNISYVFGGNATVKLAIDEEVRCSANSSQSCSYKWKWFSGSDSLTVSTDQTLKATRVGSHRCEATCPIGNTSCMVDVMFAEVYSTQSSEATMPNRQQLWFLLFLLLIPIILIIIVVLCRRCKITPTPLFLSVVGTDGNLLTNDQREEIVSKINELLHGETNENSTHLLVSNLRKYGLLEVSKVKKGIAFSFHYKNWEQLERLRDLMETNGLQRNIESIYNEVLSTNVEVKVTLSDAAFKKAKRKLQEHSVVGRFMIHMRGLDLWSRHAKYGRAAPIELEIEMPMPEYSHKTEEIDTGSIKKEIDSDDAIGKTFKEAPRIRKGLSGEIRGLMHYRDKQCICERIMCTKDQEETVCGNGQRWMALDHKNLIKFYDVIQQPSVVYIVMEYEAGGSVREALQKRTEDLRTEEVTDWATQIAHGVSHLHEKGIVHKDITSTQIFIVESTDMVKTLKIACFNLFGDDSMYDGSSIPHKIDVSPPERFTCDDISKNYDVWSFGIVVWEMLTRTEPYKGMSSRTMIQDICSGAKQLKIPNSCQKVLKEILEGCRRTRPSERPSIRNILLGLKNCFRMRKELRDILDAHRSELVKRLDINGGILNRLLSREVITADHMDDIKAERTSRRRCEMLLDKLKTRRDDKYYAIFRCEVAKEQRQLAEDYLPLTGEDLPYPKEEQTPKTTSNIDVV